MSTAMFSLWRAGTIPLIGLMALFGCRDSQDPSGAGLTPEGLAGAKATPPGPLVSLAVDGQVLNFWPFTSGKLDGQSPDDPINLVFSGEGDPRSVRAALMQLNGDRTAYGFPSFAPFDCTWSDAIGDVQGSFADPGGWTGSAIQLACGPYGPIRFHLRLFDIGGSLVANAHFEVLIPGTTDHQVLSWELAEQLVAVDLLRTGLLDASAPITPSGPINPAPSYREIPAVIYNGLPSDLRALIGGPLGDVSAGVPIGSDGSASVAHLTGHFTGAGIGSRQDLVLQFGQVIPKPFCAADGSLVYVTGPVHLVQVVSVAPTGEVTTEFQARGRLSVTPVDATGTPVGSPYGAEVREMHRASATGQTHSASSLLHQVLIPAAGPERGMRQIQVRVGTNGPSEYKATENCGG